MFSVGVLVFFWGGQILFKYVPSCSFILEQAYNVYMECHRSIICPATCGG